MTPASALDLGAADACWFAVWTRSQYEARVEEILAAMRLEVFLPRVRVASRRRDRRVVLRRPLFPSYLFVRLPPARAAYLRVAGAEGVVRLLGDRWDEPHHIPDAQVDAIRRVVAAEGARPVPCMRLGDRVDIVAGPLAGLAGRVSAWRGARATFVVNVNLLQRGVAVEVAADLLRPV